MQEEDYENKKHLEEQLVYLQSNEHLLDFQITSNKAALERGSLVVADAKVVLEGNLVHIHIGLDGNFPHSLPIVLIEPGSMPTYLPHVETDGFVCYAEKGNLVLNHLAPERVLAEAVEKSLEVLESGISGKNKWDFIDEFDAYWRSYQTARLVKSLVNPDEDAREIVVARSSTKADGVDIAYISDSDSTTIDFGIQSKIKARENGIYIPLQQGTFIDTFSKKILIAKDIRKVVTGNISPRNKKLIKRLTRKYKRDEVVVFGLPRPSGGEVLFGVLFSGVHGDHPLNDKGKAERIIPLALDRMDKSYLLPRGGASGHLENKKVALIGCGAVGGHIAFELVRSGISKLTLIDPDVIKPENIFRHVLGKEYLAKSKADALKAELESKFPYLSINSFPVKIEEVLSKSILDMNRFDLLIIATGDDNLSLKINRDIFASGIKTPVLYSWLEPYGIGGHVLVTNMEKTGCFQCLFTSMQDDNEFSNRASFAAPGQTFTIDISGCANRFTPFSALDANNTAALTVRTALKVLTGTIQSTTLLSWKGEADEFEGQGFQVSDRYRNFDVTVLSKGVNVYTPHCPVCNER
jgi:molybdopterin/thiamine biosynthesis adenylyltransferase